MTDGATVAMGQPVTMVSCMIAFHEYDELVVSTIIALVLQATPPKSRYMKVAETVHGKK